MLVSPNIKGYRSYWVDIDELLPSSDINIKLMVAHIRKYIKKPEIWYISYFSDDISDIIKFPMLLTPNSESIVRAFIDDKNTKFTKIGELKSNTYYEVFDEFAYEKYIDPKFRHIKISKITNMERFK